MMPPFKFVCPTNKIAHFVEVSLYFILFYLAQQVKLNNVSEIANDLLFDLDKLRERWGNTQFIEVEEYSEEEWDDSTSNGQQRRGKSTNIHFPVLAKVKWEYVLFNFRNKERIGIIKEELKKEKISLSDAIDENFFKKNKEKLNAIYKKVPGDFNTNSMTLFSGACTDNVRQYIYNPELYGYIHCYYKKSGCLFMGDYDASGKEKWKQLEEAYEPYLKYIGCVQIPHHGSRRSFNSKLLNIDAEFVISVGYKNRYHHPSAEVVKEIVLHKKWPWIVTEIPKSIVGAEVELG